MNLSCILLFVNHFIYFGSKAEISLDIYSFWTMFFFKTATVFFGEKWHQLISQGRRDLHAFIKHEAVTYL